MESCPSKEVLEHFLSQSLPASENQGIDTHLAGCSECQRKLHQLTDEPLEDSWRHSYLPSAGSEEAAASRVLEELPNKFVSAIGCDRSQARSNQLPRDGEHEATAGANVQIPGYAVQEELGRGTMGVVYRALQLRPAREVAIKVISPGLSGVPGHQMERLLAEADALAKVRHPNIVEIFEVSEHQGSPCLVLEYVSGGTLEQLIRSHPYSHLDAARLVEILADAMDFAHRAGFVHRDLKPGNILLTPDRRPKISDFGLAKHLATGANLTATGAVLGTPSYMAPEQASGNAETVTSATDVYALGGILFVLITGRPPFEADGAMETLLQVLHADPPAPRLLRPGVPRDLETICLHCLEKDPRRRYKSAAALAAELGRYRMGEPIETRPVGTLERCVKWARRRPAIAALLAIIFFLIVTGFPLVAWQWRVAQGRAWAEQRASASVWIDRGSSLCESGEIGPGLAAFVRGLELAAEAGDPALEQVARIDIASWKQLLIRQRAVLRHLGQVQTVAFSADGKSVFTGGSDGKIRQWDSASGRMVREIALGDFIISIATDPGDQQVLIGTENRDGKQGATWLWRLENKQQPTRLLHRGSPVLHVAFGPKGRHVLAISTSDARLWTVPEGAPVGEPIALGGIRRGAFSPDGQTLVTGGEDGRARLWHVSNVKPMGPIQELSGPVTAIAFATNGKKIAVAARASLFDATGQPFRKEWGNDRVIENQLLSSRWTSEVRIYDASLAEQKAKMTVQGEVRALTFSPDCDTLAAGTAIAEERPRKSDIMSARGEILLWNEMAGHTGVSSIMASHAVWSLAFSPNGKLLLAGSLDGKARFYDTASAEPIGAALLHEGTVTEVAISPDGRTAVTASAGGDESGAAARIWDLPDPLNRQRLVRTDEIPYTLAFNADGSVILAGARLTPSLHRWRTADLEPLVPAWPTNGPVRQIALSRDGKHVLISAENTACSIVDVVNGTVLQNLERTDILSGAYSPDNHTLMVACQDRTIRFWNLEQARMEALSYRFQGNIRLVGYAVHGEPIWIEGLMEDERRIVRCWIALADGTARILWECEGNIYAALLSPDGRAVCGAEADGRTVRFRDIYSGRPLAPTLPPQAERVFSLGYCRDGSRIVICDGSRKARVWDLSTGRPLGAPFLHLGLVFSSVFDPMNMDLVATASEDRLIHLWELPPPISGSPAQVRAQIEAVTTVGVDSR